MKKKAPKVELGKIITIIFEGTAEEVKICISPKDLMACGYLYENNPDFTYISPHAPLAQAILNHSEGEKVEFLSPSGRLVVKIVKVQ